MQFKALKFFLEGFPSPYDPHWGGLGAPPDPPAPFGHADARFPNWGLTAPTVIFWLTPWQQNKAFEETNFKPHDYPTNW